MIISTIACSGAVNGRMATETGLLGREGVGGGEDTGDESTQHQVTAFFRDRVKTFTGADKQADSSL